MRAHDDLTQVVEKVRVAVVGYAGEQVALELKKSAANMRHTTFRLYIDPDTADPEQSMMTITHFQLPAAGYPIKYGTFSKVTDSFNPAGELPDVDSLNKYFAELLSQPESVLVQALGYALRKRRM